METFRRLIESIEAEGAAALITLAETAGSAPAGARRDAPHRPLTVVAIADIGDNRLAERRLLNVSDLITGNPGTRPGNQTSAWRRSLSLDCFAVTRNDG